MRNYIEMAKEHTEAVKAVLNAIKQEVEPKGMMSPERLTALAEALKAF